MKSMFIVVDLRIQSAPNATRRWTSCSASPYSVSQRKKQVALGDPLRPFGLATSALYGTPRARTNEFLPPMEQISQTADLEHDGHRLDQFLVGLAATSLAPRSSAKSAPGLCSWMAAPWSSRHAACGGERP